MSLFEKNEKIAFVYLICLCRKCECIYHIYNSNFCIWNLNFPDFNIQTQSRSFYNKGFSVFGKGHRSGLIAMFCHPSSERVVNNSWFFIIKVMNFSPATLRLDEKTNMAMRSDLHPLPKTYKVFHKKAAQVRTHATKAGCIW